MKNKKSISFFQFITKSSNFIANLIDYCSQLSFEVHNVLLGLEISYVCKIAKILVFLVVQKPA